MTRTFAGLAALLALAGCGIFGGDAPPPAGGRWTFDAVPVGHPPSGWAAEATNPSGTPAAWQVQPGDETSRGRVLAVETARDASRGVFNLCWTRGVAFRDGTLSVRVRADRGTIDQGGGPIWRARDARNYYIARYNPLEKNFRVYVVKDGTRRQLATAPDLDIPAGRWFLVTVVHRGDRIACHLDGKPLLEATDATFPEAGGVGLWTKADAATSFDDLVVTPAQVD